MTNNRDNGKTDPRDSVDNVVRDVPFGKKLRPCPNCGARKGVPIIYGLPTQAALEDAARGEFVLGGCVVREDDPQARCADCGHRW